MVLRGMAAAGCLLLFAVGCGDSGSSRTSISGTVKYQGAPLNFGRIYFTINRGEVTRSARIESDGAYVVKDVPLGEAQIAVIVLPAYQGTPNDPSAPTFGGSLPTNVDRVIIPERYSDISTSGLTLSVSSGPLSHHLDLQ